MAAPANAEASVNSFCRIFAKNGPTEFKRAFEIDNAPGELEKPKGTVANPMLLEGKVLLILTKASPTEPQPKEWCSLPVLAKEEDLVSILEVAMDGRFLQVQLGVTKTKPDDDKTKPDDDVPSVFYFQNLLVFSIGPGPTVSEMDTKNDKPAGRKFQLAFEKVKKEEDQTKIDAIVGQVEVTGRNSEDREVHLLLII